MEQTLVVSMGDANGVGPEILVKAHAMGHLRHPYYVVGDAAALEKAQRLLVTSHNIHIMNSEDDLLPGALNLLDAGILSKSDIHPGELSARVGEASRVYVERAVKAVQAGKAAAMVTLPVSKEAVQLTTPGFSGHTELIAHMCGQRDYTMMLSSDRLTVTHVSTHVSMREAIAAVTRARVLGVLRLTQNALIGPLGRQPRIAVAGLNAHAGEGGLFGKEEVEQIAPAVGDARSAGIEAGGPYPPDTVFLRAVKGEFDAVVCMYHDQGHIPLKLLDFSGGVNVTLGLSLIRTSVDHGTAYDIAYRGVADTGSFVRAFAMAADMAAERERKGL